MNEKTPLNFPISTSIDDLVAAMNNRGIYRGEAFAMAFKFDFGGDEGASPVVLGFASEAELLEFVGGYWMESTGESNVSSEKIQKLACDYWSSQLSRDELIERINAISEFLIEWFGTREEFLKGEGTFPAKIWRWFGSLEGDESSGEEARTLEIFYDWLNVEYMQDWFLFEFSDADAKSP